MEDAPPRHRSRRDALPEDALYEILLRLPAEDICRLHAVCWPWRSLLSDPHFIAAHAARHPEPPPPLVVVGYAATELNGLELCDIVDLSGRVVKRVHATGVEDADGLDIKWVVYTHADLICVTNGIGMSCQILNLATGAVVHALPDGLAPEHAEFADARVQEQDDLLSGFCATIVFGLVPSTGKYKVLRMVQDLGCPVTPMLYEVLTFDGSSQAAHWRGTQAPPYLELFHHDISAVISGIAYFFLSDYDLDYYYGTDIGLVGSFDLETEKWRPSIPGPSSCHEASLKDIKIASLSGHLALCCRTTSSSSVVSPTMDIWFLTDFHKGSWAKQHSIKVSLLHVPHLAQPLLMLNDEGITCRNENWAFLQNYYDHKIIDTSIDGLQKKDCVVVGLYGGNLLSLTNRTS